MQSLPFKRQNYNFINEKTLLDRCREVVRRLIQHHQNDRFSALD
ncbi:hypothetical protein QWZ13_02780 [Reinekea marina]|nr:hypothetical protein [Reinekea marina]MDN3647835.1 hypothetical protein [Reinekea marina]